MRGDNSNRPIKIMDHGERNDKKCNFISQFIHNLKYTLLLLTDHVLYAPIHNSIDLFPISLMSILMERRQQDIALGCKNWLTYS